MDDEPVEVEVLRTLGGVNADTIVAALRGNGIPARVRGEAIGTVCALTLDGLGEVSILVPAEFAEQAREVLAAAERGILDLGAADPTSDPGPGDR
jgi:hypothetical protein